jgi:hypothetical protein
MRGTNSVCKRHGTFEKKNFLLHLVVIMLRLLQLYFALARVDSGSGVLCPLTPDMIQLKS